MRSTSGSTARARDGQALPPAAGQRVDGRVPVGEAALAQGKRDATGPVAFVHAGQSGRDNRLHGEAGLEDRVLRNIADPYATPDGTRAMVRGGEAGEDLEEGGLARAVRSYEADLVPFEEPERELFEESPGPVGLADRVAAEKKRWGHHALLFLLRLLFLLLHAHAFGHGAHLPSSSCVGSRGSRIRVGPGQL